MRTIKLQIAASETHCSECEHANGRRCDVFGMRMMSQDWDYDTSTWKRLPACIAAEKEAAK